ncbi:hypothetical protein L484_005566 [Morus notabilis]|uniref:Uncharacterized protein n=1 Tax=Morus notabilis TaxID=981085 RepID=W9QVN3_9ROSA|nr:hypothetical protein L484_005566 [Morus notabilis]
MEAREGILAEKGEEKKDFGENESRRHNEGVNKELIREAIISPSEGPTHHQKENDDDHDHHDHHDDDQDGERLAQHPHDLLVFSRSVHKIDSSLE